VTADLEEPGSLDLSRYIRPGDLVVWGQACAEPLTLTELLAAQRRHLGGIRCFTGISRSAAVRPEHGDGLSFVSYTGAGANRALAEAGRLDILPSHYSALPGLLTSGPLRADVLLLALPPAGPDGTFGLGAGADYAAALIGRARTVIAEVNDQAPEVAGDRRLRPDEIDVMVAVSRPLPEYPQPPPRPEDAAIAGYVASRTAPPCSLALARSRRRWRTRCAVTATSVFTRASSPTRLPG